jgi:hypothetical protein
MQWLCLSQCLVQQEAVWRLQLCFQSSPALRLSHNTNMDEAMSMYKDVHVCKRHEHGCVLSPRPPPPPLPPPLHTPRL